MKKDWHGHALPHIGPRSWHGPDWYGQALELAWTVLAWTGTGTGMDGSGMDRHRGYVSAPRSSHGSSSNTRARESRRRVRVFPGDPNRIVINELGLGPPSAYEKRMALQCVSFLPARRSFRPPGPMWKVAVWKPVEGGCLEADVEAILWHARADHPDSRCLPYKRKRST